MWIPSGLISSLGLLSMQWSAAPFKEDASSLLWLSIRPPDSSSFCLKRLDWRQRRPGMFRTTGRNDRNLIRLVNLAVLVKFLAPRIWKRLGNPNMEICFSSGLNWPDYGQALAVCSAWSPSLSNLVSLPWPWEKRNVSKLPGLIFFHLLKKIKEKPLPQLIFFNCLLLKVLEIFRFIIIFFPFPGKHFNWV